jgi:uracil-DNA glycosylase family 4
MQATAKGTLIPGSKIMIVGEHSTTDELTLAVALHSKSTPGAELDRMLQELGIARTECSVTNIVKVQMPGWNQESLYLDKKMTKPGPMIWAGAEELKAEIARVKPTVILALGNMALQVLTGKSGIMKWRGSVMQTLPEFGSIKVIPTYHPSVVLRMWEWRPIALRDIKRLRDECEWPEIRRPEWNFALRPSFAAAVERLEWIRDQVAAGPYKLSVDIETRGLIACVGLAWNKTDAICLPLMAVGHPQGYWTVDEELVIWGLLREILTHKNVIIIGQNFAYDAQYFSVQMGFLPIVKLDTMVMQHTYLAGSKKSLDFIASMYCEYYCYWKDDGKTWDPKIPEEKYWFYNCEDCIRTYECAEVLETILAHSNLTEQYAFLQRMWPNLVRTMLKGVRIDEKTKSLIAMELMTFLNDTNGEIKEILGHEINVKSPLQMRKLFYDDFQMKPVKDKKTKQLTTNDDALTLFKKREPLLTGLVERIQMCRSAGVLFSTFANMPLDIDKRMRCYYNIAGTETYRLNSGENAFGSGGNLQNIPAGDEEKDAERKRSEIALGRRQLLLPNMRKMFIPDSGMTFFDVDLDRADLMVVIWEADDDGLRNAVAAGVDLHTYNASALFGILKLVSQSLNAKQRRCSRTVPTTAAVRELWPSIAGSLYTNLKQCSADGSLSIRVLKTGIVELKLNFRLLGRSEMYSAFGADILTELKVYYLRPLPGSPNLPWLSLSIKVGKDYRRTSLKSTSSCKSTTVWQGSFQRHWQTP